MDDTSVLRLRQAKHLDVRIFGKPLIRLRRDGWTAEMMIFMPE
jgi:hypothetical protein